MIEIQDESIKRKVIFLLNNLWFGKYSHFFPHQICDYIERKDIFKIKTFLYCYYKSNTKNEKRALLFLFIDSNCDKKAYVIFKDFSIHSIEIDCNSDYYNNTLFDISISPDGKIIIYDTIYVSGIKINNYPFMDRILEAQNFKTHTNNPIFEVCSYMQGISSLSDSLKQYEEEIFLISNELPIIVGLNRGCFKWQPSESIYFSLKVIELEHDLVLNACNYKKDVPFAKIHFSDPNGEIYINKIKKLEDYKNECVIDVGVNENENEIIIIRVSKTFPSSLRYIEKMLRIKRENIKINELIK